MTAETALVHRGPERRRAVLDSYARVLQALDAGGVGTWEWDLATDMVLASRTHERLFGCPAADAGTMEATLACVHPDDRETQRRALDESRTHGVDYAQEFRIIRADGGVRWVQRVGRFVGPDRTLMVGTAVDVTERRQSEEAVRQTEHRYREALAALYEAERVARAEAESARVDAETANRAKTEFLAVMSHELRTPLNAIAGYSDLMAFGIHGPVTRSQVEDLDGIQRAQRHLLSLIDQVLSYARIEAGTLGYNLADVPLEAAVRAVEHLMSPQLSSKRISFRFDSCGPDLTVHTDSERLRQILINLVNNALKFTDHGGRIDVRCLPGDDEVEIEVRDTGIGIPADQLDYIFEPFVQLDPRLTRSEGGVGLGLSISRDLARAMGGELTVTSRVHDGSTFVLRVPRGRTVGGTTVGDGTVGDKTVG